MSQDVHICQFLRLARARQSSPSMGAWYAGTCKSIEVGSSMGISCSWRGDVVSPHGGCPTTKPTNGRWMLLNSPNSPAIGCEDGLLILGSTFFIATPPFLSSDSPQCLSLPWHMWACSHGTTPSYPKLDDPMSLFMDNPASGTCPSQFLLSLLSAIVYSLVVDRDGPQRWPPSDSDISRRW